MTTWSIKALIPCLGQTLKSFNYHVKAMNCLYLNYNIIYNICILYYNIFGHVVELVRRAILGVVFCIIFCEFVSLFILG